MSKKHEFFLILGLFLGSMVISTVFWSLLPAEYRQNQSTDYLNHYEPVARAIASGQGVTLDGTIATRYPPGFSLLLAGVFRAGEGLGMGDETALTLFRLVCAGLSVILVYALARLVWTPLLALIPALAWMTYPFALWLTKQPNSEVPYIPFLYATIFVFWLALLRKPNSVGLYLLAGLLAGSAMLIRPAAIGLGILMAGLTIVLTGKEIAMKHRFRAAVLILLGNFLAILPWQAAVYAQTNAIIPLGSGGAITIQDGLTFLAVPKEYRREVDIPEDVAEMMWTFHERRQEMQTGGDALAVMIEEGQNAPIAFIKLIIIKAVRSWYGIDSRSFELPTILLQLFYLFFVLWGTVASIRREGNLRRLMIGDWLIVLYFWAMTVLVIPLFRYMLPMMGLLMIALPGVYLSLRSWAIARKISVNRSLGSDY